ncbi:MAG TPA: ABC transporter ATP-binding protein [Byssovorax sp.]
MKLAPLRDPPLSGGKSDSKRPTGGPLVQVERLSKLFAVRGAPFSAPRFVHAVDGVSLYVRRAETLGLVGESGSGKSTLGRAILRLVEPTLGRVTFDGADVTAMPERELRALRRRMQMIFQDPYSSLNPRMTVREIVGEGVTIFKLAGSRGEADDLVTRALERVGLRADALGRYPHEFSGGQRQRIGIARALVVDPSFIVCDEPVSALDLSVQAQVVNLLEELQDELGVSYLFISHDLRVVTYTSHRVGVMVGGRIVEMGPSADVATKQLHPYTRALFSAVPRLEPDAPRVSVTDEGERASVALPRRLLVHVEPPSPLEEPRGCVFHTRCPKFEPGKCDEETPSLSEVVTGSHHRVACFFPETDPPT